MKDLWDLKDLTIHGVQPISDAGQHVRVKYDEKGKEGTDSGKVRPPSCLVFSRTASLQGIFGPKWAKNLFPYPQKTLNVRMALPTVGHIWIIRVGGHGLGEGASLCTGRLDAI